VRIVDFDDIEAQLWRLSENLHRAELTKLQYDNQVVEYAELLKAKQAGETSAERQPLLSGESGAKLSHEDNVASVGRPESDKLRQVAALSGGRGNTGGYREAARELNIPERTVRRAYQTASLSPEAQEAAVETGLDDNRSALLEAAKVKNNPKAQAAIIRGIAERKTLAGEPSPRQLPAIGPTGLAGSYLPSPTT
jgi:hypothetical protein